jgi:hypothetical protein
MEEARLATSSLAVGTHGRRKAHRLGLADLMSLVAGIGVGFWLVSNDLRRPPDDQAVVWSIAFAILGGLALVGPPLLLVERFGRASWLWGPGRILWFSQGVVLWLLLPSLVYYRVLEKSLWHSVTFECMLGAMLFLSMSQIPAFLIGGWLRDRQRLARGSWREVFGLLLGLASSCVGAYALYLIHIYDFGH